MQVKNQGEMQWKGCFLNIIIIIVVINLCAEFVCFKTYLCNTHTRICNKTLNY